MMKIVMSIAFAIGIAGSALADDIVIRIQQPKAAVAVQAAPVVAYAPAVRYVRTSAPYTVAYVRTSTPYVRTRVGFTGGVVATGYSVGRVRADDGTAIRKMRRTPLRTAVFGF